MSQTLALQFPGAVLLAAAAGTPDDRVRTGLLVPWDEPGRTNLGPGYPVRRTFAQGLQASAKLVGVYGHNQPAQVDDYGRVIRPAVPAPSVTRVLEWQDRPEGLWARIFVNRTPLGDQLLAEIDGGARDGLSIEATDLVFDTAGGIVAGRVDFYAHVPVGAYDSARALALAAALATPGERNVTQPYQAAPAALPAGQLAGAPPAAYPLPAPPQVQPAPAPAPAAPPAQPAPAVQWYQVPAPPAPQAQPVPAPAPQPVPQLQAQVFGQPAPAPAAQPPAPADPFAGFLAQLQAAQALGGTPVQPPTPQTQLQASAVTGLPAPGLPTPPAAGSRPEGFVRRLAQLQAAQAQGYQSPELFAALHDVVNGTGNGAQGATRSVLDLFQAPASAVGQELWSGAEYERRFVPLMNFQELTSWKFTGWRWKEKPRVQDWNGDKSEIPTNPVSVEPVDGEAERCAGGWDVDRKFRDLPTPGFWEGFYRAQTESYRELSDLRAAAALVEFALDITVDANVPVGYRDGANVAQADILRAAALGGAILEDTPNVRRSADYVLMNTGDWLGLMDLTNLDLPAFLTLLGVKPGAFLRTDQVPSGSVILGVKPAATFRELGGGAPIRVEALDVARGGIDSAVYGYTACSLDRPGGIISVPLVPAG